MLNCTILLSMSCNKKLKNLSLVSNKLGTNLLPKLNKSANPSIKKELKLISPI